MTSKIFNNAGASFSFHYVSLDETSNEIDTLNPEKASEATDIPNIVIKKSKDLISFYVYHSFIKSLSNSLFPTPLKHTDLRPNYKEDNKVDKINYSSISTVPNIIKVYERLMYDQLYPYRDIIFPKLQ